MYYVGVRVRSQGQGWLRGFALVGGDGAGMQNADTTLLGSSEICMGFLFPFPCLSLYEYIVLRFWYLKPGLLPN